METKVLDSRTLKIIKEQIVPPIRADRIMTLLDWEHIIETAIYLGINVDAEIERLTTATLIINPNFMGLKLLSLDRRRKILAELDKRGGTMYLQKFEKRLNYLKKVLNIE